MPIAASAIAFGLLRVVRSDRKIGIIPIDSAEPWLTVASGWQRPILDSSSWTTVCRTTGCPGTRPAFPLSLSDSDSDYADDGMRLAVLRMVN